MGRGRHAIYNVAVFSWRALQELTGQIVASLYFWLAMQLFWGFRAFQVGSFNPANAAAGWEAKR